MTGKPGRVTHVVYGSVEKVVGGEANRIDYRQAENDREGRD